ncbi:MAG: hypothetical protein VKL59_04145 [Nostocaceae cyanobacterium]|nr:hypothetical protein [Nostocaceae cyanobacterium]
MSKPLDIKLSIELAQRIPKLDADCFQNAYQATLITPGAMYVQGFLVIADQPDTILEYGWIELDTSLVDPTFIHWQKNAEELFYFAAQKLTLKQLLSALQEAQEDYPEDNPLPVYGTTPYEYYGEVMLGGQEYKFAYEQAVNKSRQLNEQY